jgi:hypothetical protein
LNLEPDGGGLAYWSGRLDKGEAQWTVAQAFMISAGVSSCSYPNVPKTGVSTTTPTAPATTKPTTTQAGATDYTSQSNAWVVLSAAHLENAKKENAATYQISLKNPVSKTDLQTIASKDGYVRGAITQLQSGVGKVSSIYNQAISNTSTKAQGPAIQAHLKSLQANIASLNNYLVNISNDYKRAESTYQANLSFYAKVTDRQRVEADCKAKGLSYNAFTNNCPTPKAADPNEDNGSGGGRGGGSARKDPVTKKEAELPLYASPNSVNCLQYDGSDLTYGRPQTVGTASHGNYYTCIVRFNAGLKKGETAHYAKRMLMSCPTSYHIELHESKNIAGTAGYTWWGRLCKRD